MKISLSHVWPSTRGAYRLARFLRRRIPRKNWDGIFCTPQGSKLQLDLATYPDCAMAFGLYELGTMRALRRLLRPGAWFIDGGANIGYFTLLAAKWVGPAGRVDAFEPHPANRARLLANLERNAVGSFVRVHAFALGAVAGEATLFTPVGDRFNHGEATLYPDGNALSTPTRVVRLDQLFAPGAVPDVIKLDIEGAEHAALQGAASLLASANPPALIIEHNPVTAAHAGHPPGALFDVLKSLQPRYQIFRLGTLPRRVRSAAQLQSLQRELNLLAIASRS